MYVLNQHIPPRSLKTVKLNNLIRRAYQKYITRCQIYLGENNEYKPVRPLDLVFTLHTSTHSSVFRVPKPIIYIPW